MIKKCIFYTTRSVYNCIFEINAYVGYINPSLLVTNITLENPNICSVYWTTDMLYRNPRSVRYITTKSVLILNKRLKYSLMSEFLLQPNCSECVQLFLRFLCFLANLNNGSNLSLANTVIKSAKSRSVRGSSIREYRNKM